MNNTSMAARAANHLWIAGTILFTVYGQIVIKWQVSRMGQLPDSWHERAGYFIHAVLNPWIFSGLAAAFIAFLCWVAALSKFDLNYAYPFMALSYVLVLFLSGPLLGEGINAWKIAGVVLVALGVVATGMK